MLELLELERPAAELPGRLGAGMLLRPSLELMINAELRLLEQQGGSMELAVVETDAPQAIREVVSHARDRRRLCAIALGPSRVVIYKRDAADGAAAQMHELLSSLHAMTPLRGVGAASIESSHFPALAGNDLVRLSELALDRALQHGGGMHRLVLKDEVTGDLVMANHPSA